ncbi:transcription elongation factor B, polypeptide 1 [Cryptococcus wingfieldii CBS 7118]|uniref:Elongin-C n=1 Tax=Cryptococcus wingfieldii CBS 7118 TaxID=1295528 RepID=A0A1E3J0G4_9TREE|nr:transcription elongation factor B, polypeptide 1 [Cryptococcus wingfieldii CBS 7118]ODN94302.1 transcription elongation factor B, polypeptide 1 [Cryptococcus wingfieldii CBS 7118]
MSSGKKPQGAGDDYVLLESSDGYTFVVSRKIACASSMLKNMLDEDAAFSEATNKACKIQQRGCILLKVIEYLAYKVQYQEFNAEDVQEDFQDRIDPYIALELLTAADYLDC